jgi:hypothetical protein
VQYILLLYQDEAGFWFKLSPDELQKAVAAYTAFTESMEEAGILVEGNRFQPYTSASTVRMSSGKLDVRSGPYTQSKEQLGGYFLIDVVNHETAVEWAARCPAAWHGVVEVRPLG